MSNNNKTTKTLNHNVRYDMLCPKNVQKSFGLRDDIKFIPIKRTLPLKFALVDAEDYEILKRFSWCLSKGRQTCYARRSTSRKNGGQRTVLMHRQIMGFPQGQVVDYIDGNGLNNTRANLRICTIQQNHFNRPKRRKASSQYKGVAWSKARKKWFAQTRINGRQINIGFFDSEIEAAKAYDKKALELFGEYARLNFGK